MGRKISLTNRVEGALELQRRPDLAEQREVLLTRAGNLPPQDRQLLEIALSGRCSYRQLARSLGRDAGCLSRRINTLLRRLRHPVVVAVQDHAHLLAPVCRQLATEHFLLGRPLGMVARKLQLSRPQAIAMAGYLEGWARSTLDAERRGECAPAAMAGAEA
jgi:hypothetical protein